MTEKINNGKSVSMYTACALYFVCLIALSIFAYKKPMYNWDMLGYMAVILKMDGKDNSEIHDLVYQSAQANIPAGAFSDLTKSESAYRKLMRESAPDFYNQLPFYVVKPLYTSLGYVFYHLGFSLPASTVLPSVLAFILSGLLLIYWLSKYLSTGFAAIASILFMCSGFMTYTARLSSPDAVSGFLLFSAFYFIVEKPSLAWTTFFFILAIFARIDNILACFLVASFLFFAGKWQLKIQLRHYLVVILLLTGVYFFVGWNVKSYGWQVSFYPSFFERYKGYLNTSFSIRDYFSLWTGKFMNGLLYSHLSIFLLMITLVIARSRPFKFSRLSFNQLLLLLLVLILVLRFILFPDISDNFYTGYYLIIFVVFVKTFFSSGSYTRG